MARPRRSEHTKENLLERGVQLLASNGYHGTGLKEILDAVRVPKGSFYNYFESKEAFAAEIIRHYVDQLLSVFDAYVAHSQEAPLCLIKSLYSYMLVEFARQDCQQGCLVGNLAAEIGASSPLCQIELKRAFGHWKTRFVKLLEAGQQQGNVRNDISADALADIFWNTWEGGILRMKIEGNTGNLKKTLEVLLDQLFAAPA
jgi:TetR/AcrR family transcriptional regulator, transcriptional repressor for nem operon